jgi:DNA-binding GntR family transcriptional regulator
LLVDIRNTMSAIPKKRIDMNTTAMAPLDGRGPMIADIVYGRLYRAITERQLEPGTLLTEQGVAAQLKVSKTPVREALLRLRQVGLIEPEGRRGLRVVKLSVEGLRQVLEIREALETYVAARAAERPDAASCAAISAAAQASLDAAERGDIVGFHHHDRAFHAEIAKTIANPQMMQQIDNAVAQVQTLIRRDAFPKMDEMVECARTHVRIAAAISAGARDIAAREMAAHVRKIHELIVTGALQQDAGRA